LQRLTRSGHVSREQLLKPTQPLAAQRADFTHVQSRWSLLKSLLPHFLCSAHAGYITAQNLLIDGGAYPGTF
jgi:hypothetical protein